MAVKLDTNTPVAMATMCIWGATLFASRHHQKPKILERKMVTKMKGCPSNSYSMATRCTTNGCIVVQQLPSCYGNHVHFGRYFICI